jgi:hypothetical protein
MASPVCLASPTPANLPAATAVPVPVFTCVRCGRQTTNRSEAGWSIRPWKTQDGRPLTAATCGPCLVGTTGQPSDLQLPCDQSCDGQYVGIRYFAAVCPDEPDGGERWACWDEACTTAWAAEHTEKGCTSAHPGAPRVQEYLHGATVHRFEHVVPEWGI